MTFDQVMKELESLGTAQNQKIYLNHGCDIKTFGVSVANLKTLYKSIKNDVLLGMELLNSDVYDAMYLSQWLVDANLLTMSDLESLINVSNFYVVVENIMPSIIINNKALTQECIDKWMNSGNDRKRQCAYSLYALVLGKYPNNEINQDDVIGILNHIEKTIHKEENRVKYVMNNFVICAGIYDKQLTDYCINIAQNIGEVNVFMGKTACKVPYAPDYINKVKTMGRIGLKR